jgi:hypothetical protein
MPDAGQPDLRAQLAQSFSKTATANGRRLGELRFALADAAVEIFNGEAGEQLVADMMQRTRLREADFRGGMHMDIAAARELTATYVAAARAMLGDAENYSETPVEFEVGLAGETERYVLIVQRAGKLTPHQARRNAETERDTALAHLNQARALRIPAASLAGAVDPAVHTPDRVRAYLTGRGWRPVPGVRDWWQHDAFTVVAGGEPVPFAKLYAPSDAADPDYVPLISKCVCTLGDLYAIGGLRILADIAEAASA